MPSDAERSRVLREVNAVLGRDAANLSKCRELRDEYSRRKEKAVRDVQQVRSGGAAASEKSVADTTAVKSGYDELSRDVCRYLEETDERRNKIDGYLRKIEVLQCGLEMLKTCALIDELSGELHRAVCAKDDERCATAFANLCEASRSLVGCPAVNLQLFLRETLHHWHNLLKDKFAGEFGEVLAAVRWPFVERNASLQSPSRQTVQRLQLLSEYLFQIQLPEECGAEAAVTSAPVPEFRAPSLPVALMLRPLRKRFIYHFYGARQTNRADKPEWYFSQILSWIRDHEKFVGSWIQPAADRLGMAHVDAREELTRGLVRLAVEKLRAELPAMQYDDFTFSHCVDEALGFDRELVEVCDYDGGDVLTVLTQAQVFIKWLSLEKKYALEKMDSVLSSEEDAFCLVSESDGDGDREELKVTVCGDAFVTLLRTITERYEFLPQPGHRLQFLELQLELLDDFRIRLLQVRQGAQSQSQSDDRRLGRIANTLYYVETVLEDLGTTVHFLQLHHYRGDAGSEGVFDEALELYGRVRRETVDGMSERAARDASARSRAYRRDRWAEMPRHSDRRSYSLTASACPVFEVLATRLHQLRDSLAAEPFADAWKAAAERLDAYLFEELVLQNRFGDGGAAQLEFDVTRNLFPLFGQFTDAPAAYFGRMADSCLLLNLGRGTAMLLRGEPSEAALDDVGVRTLTGREAVAVLGRRCDLNSIGDMTSALNELL